MDFRPSQVFNDLFFELSVADPALAKRVEKVGAFLASLGRLGGHIRQARTQSTFEVLVTGTDILYRARAFLILAIVVCIFHFALLLSRV